MDPSKIKKLRLEGYSDRVLQEAAHPHNMRRMTKADARGVIHGCCGDTMEIYLQLDGEQIATATFMTDGRESAIACGSMLTRLVEKKTLAEAGLITPDELITALQGLPPAKTHCAKLVLNTLEKAIANWQEKDTP